MLEEEVQCGETKDYIDHLVPVSVTENVRSDTHLLGNHQVAPQSQSQASEKGGVVLFCLGAVFLPPP